MSSHDGGKPQNTSLSSTQIKTGLNIPYIENNEIHNFYDFLQTAKNKTKAAFEFLLKRIRPKSFSKKFKSRRNDIRSTLTGRPIKEIKYRPGKTPISAYPSIKQALLNGHYNLSRKQFHILKNDFMGLLKRQKESMTLILAIDVSNSTLTSIMLFCDVLSSLTKYFKRNNDRIGLIAIRDNKAKVLNYPTHNFKVVLRSMRALKVSGATPLADGLKASLEMARAEKRIKVGSKSLVILLSDCFPEPLTHKYNNPFDEPAYQDVVKQAGKFKREQIQLLVIKPKYQLKVGEKREETLGDKLAREIIKRSNGKCIDIESYLGDSGIRINLLESVERHDYHDLIIQNIGEALFRS